LSTEARGVLCKHCGHDTLSPTTRSVVVDQPGHPVSARCTLGYCRDFEHDPEVCLVAAIQLQDGRVVRGHRHNDCIRTIVAWQKAGQDVGRTDRSVQGFLTSRGRFVNREEGADLMKAVRHVVPRTGRVFIQPTLYSEDLY